MSYTKRLKKTSLYCPYCGEQGLLVDDCDDYYMGCLGTCPACDQTHPNFDFHDEDGEITEVQIG